MRVTPVSQPFFIISSMWFLVMASVTYCNFFFGENLVFLVVLLLGVLGTADTHTQTINLVLRC